MKPWGVPCPFLCELHRLLEVAGSSKYQRPQLACHQWQKNSLANTSEVRSPDHPCWVFVHLDLKCMPNFINNPAKRLKCSVGTYLESQNTSENGYNYLFVW